MTNYDKKGVAISQTKLSGFITLKYYPQNPSQNITLISSSTFTLVNGNAGSVIRLSQKSDLNTTYSI